MKVIWLLIVFQCEGHVNAVCWPEVKTYEHKADCIREFNAMKPITYDGKKPALCIATVNDEPSQ